MIPEGEVVVASFWLKNGWRADRSWGESWMKERYRDFKDRERPRMV